MNDNTLPTGIWPPNTCPRRMAEAGPWEYAQGLDAFEDHVCNFCGSLDEETFLAAAAEGKEIVPTDKNYKVFVPGVGRGKFYFQHLSEAGRQIFIELCNERPFRLNLGQPGYFYILPFFVREVKK